jgi:hypothetical protein
VSLSIGVRSQKSGVRIFAVVIGLILLAGCGGSGTTTTTTTITTPTPVINSIPIAVNAGPSSIYPAVNFPYVSVTVCTPGSTSSCATINNVQVDTGSSGLRILASALGSSVSLTPVSGNGTPVDECYPFGDGSYIWGPVMQADVSMAGEKAAGLPIQVINSPGSGVAVPNGCSQGSGVNRGTVDELQANGILGIGVTQQDCGVSCVGTSVAPYYWLCPSAGCTGNASVPTSVQVSNPVIFFSLDNNGAMITLPPVAATGTASVGGTLTFGIGTQTDNALGSAKVYALGLWPSGAYAGAYTIKSTYNGVDYPAYLDTAVPTLYFLDPTALGIPTCSGTYTSLYCPSSTANFTVSNVGYQGTAANASIAIANAQTLLSNSSFVAFSNLAGPSGTGSSNDIAEFGLPFFYGRTVFVGIQGQSPPTGVSAPAGYFAF